MATYNASFNYDEDPIDLIKVNFKQPKENQDETKQLDRTKTIPDENQFKTLAFITVPFLIAGFGMVAAGILLDVVQDWELFQKIGEIIILVPALLGLKGNLEMTLASRLSTQVNIGKVHDKKSIISAVIGNSVLIQLQSIVVGFLASFIACISEYIAEQNFVPAHLLTLIVSSVVTASLASFLLASIVMFIIIVSSKFNVNPDNIATPIASSLGDLVTLAILAYLGTVFYNYKSIIYIPIIIIVVYLLLIPVFIYICHNNEFVKETLYQGWIPIISAMLISSGAGIILGVSVKIYPVVAVYQPVINGVGGNLVAIFASRLSTSIHRTSVRGEYPSWTPQKYIFYPFQTFFGKLNPEASTARLLALLILPGHMIFFFTLYYLKAIQSGIELTVWLVFFYLSFAFIQVIILLLLCYWLVLFVWKLKNDPDNVCIPYLTSIGDLLGVGFLLLCMHIVYLTGNTSLTETTQTPLFFNTTTPAY